MANNNDILERVARLEERVDNGLKYIREQIDEIRDNHLHALQTDIGDLKKQVSALTVKMAAIIAIASLIAGAIVEVLFRYVFKW